MMREPAKRLTLLGLLALLAVTFALLGERTLSHAQRSGPPYRDPPMFKGSVPAP